MKRRLFGFDQDAVHRLFERQRDAHDELERQLADLRSRLEVQQAELDDLREREARIPEAITTAQRAADQILADARAEEQQIRAAAEAEAQRRLDLAEEQLAELAELTRTLGLELVDHAADVRTRLHDARQELAPDPEPPPVDAADDAGDEVGDDAGEPASTEDGAVPVDEPPAEAAGVPVDDLPAEGERVVRVRLWPIESPADAARAERRVHGVGGVRSVRLASLGERCADLLVGIDADHLDVGPLLEDGAELVAADSDAIELRVPPGWGDGA